MKKNPEKTYATLVARHGAKRQEKFANASVGIAGLGGLGSHIAIHLTRLGVGKLVLVDFDIVDESNLHRQHYTLQDIGKRKTEALLLQLHEINPYLTYITKTEKLTAKNTPSIFSDCKIICEAFDVPSEKAMLVETVLSSMPKQIIVGANGMAGIANANNMKVTKPMSRYFLCGDGKSDVANDALYAPRVALCAAQQASVVMQLILNEFEIE